MNKQEIRNLKKRMMFIKSDDVYYISYNVILLLSGLNCTTQAKPFKDYRKFTFLVEFVSDPNLLAIVSEAKSLGLRPNNSERHELALAYARAAARQPHVMRVICALESRRFLSIEKGSQAEGFDVFLRLDQLPQGFLADDLYEVERQNIKSLRVVSTQLRTMRFETMLQQLFSQNGVEVWHA